MPTDISAGPSAYPTGRVDPTIRTVPGNESAFSGVSWAAIVAGGVAAAAMAMILVVLGTGLGLVSVSPWPNEGASAATIGAGVIIWSIIIEVAAFGLGGYIAGRLRTKWANIHGDEVYFRDTAHGFVTWALGTLVGVALVTSAAGHIARGGAEVGAAAAGVGAAAAGGAGAMAMNAGPAGGPAGPMGMRGGGGPADYYIDMLFRPAGPAGAPANGATGGTTTGSTTTGQATGTDTGAAMTGTPPAPPAGAPAGGPGAGPRSNDLGPVRAEIGQIVATSFKDGQITLSPTDRTYVASLIAQRTGLSQADAEKRVDDVVNQAKAAMDDLAQKARQAADDARKAGAALALWTFVSMLIGAFVASYAATIGGRHRDL